MFNIDKSITLIEKYVKDNITYDLQLLQDIASILEHNFNGYLSDNQLQALLCFVNDIGLEEFFNTNIPGYIMNGELALVRREILSFNRIGRTASATLTAKRNDEVKLFCEGM